jgi:predicted kinase
VDVPLLVVVTGPPASGKTTAAEELAAELGLAILSKDTFKETLYETIGSGDEVEAQIERAALALLFAVAGMQLEAEVSLLVESNFDAETDVAPFEELSRSHDVRMLQVHIGGDVDALVEKFARRAESGRRHPGHGDEASDADEVRRKIEAGHWEPLDLPGTLVRADVSDSPGEIVRRVREAIDG